MDYDKENFFHHFNTRKKTYSENEIRYQIEVISRVKLERLTDGERVKALTNRSLVEQKVL